MESEITNITINAFLNDENHNNIVMIIRRNDKKIIAFKL